MYTIKFEEECECFKKSGFENNTTELLRSNALMKANQMCNILNNKFGGEGYIVVEEKRSFIIKKGKKNRPAHCCGDGCCF